MKNRIDEKSKSLKMLIFLFCFHSSGIVCIPEEKDERVAKQSKSDNMRILNINNTKHEKMTSTNAPATQVSVAPIATASTAAEAVATVKRNCTICNQLKEQSAFAPSEWKRAEKSKTGARCRTCRKFDDVLRRYGLTREKYMGLLEKQKHQCALCRCALSEKLVHVDHWHDNRRRVRGLLCANCNTGIGKLGDTADGLLRGALYICNAMGTASPTERTAIQSFLTEIKNVCDQAASTFDESEQPSLAPSNIATCVSTSTCSTSAKQ